MADNFRDSGDDRSIAYIHEVYNGKNSVEAFEHELDKAIEDNYSVIVIEPKRLGDETSNWITMGNCLHKTACLSGLASLASAAIWTDKPCICTPLSIVSIFCSGVYTLAWQMDPCVHYQVESKMERLLPKYPELSNITVHGAMSPVVLVRGNRNSLWHSSVTLLAAVVCIWRIREALK